MFSSKDLGITKSENAKNFNSIRKNKCIHLNCNSDAISSHTFPENYLKKYFSKKVGDKSLVYAITPSKHYIENPNINNKVDSKENIHFFECSTKNAGALPLFCNEHDTNIFREVDQIPFDQNVENEFLNYYRHFAYTYVLESHFDKTLNHEYGNPALSSQAKQKLNLATEIFNRFFKYDKTELENYLNKIHKIFGNNNIISEKYIKSEFIIKSFEIKENLPWCASGTTNYNHPEMSNEIWVTLMIYPIPREEVRFR